MKITVSNNLIAEGLPDNLISAAVRDLTLPNPEYVKRERMGRWTGDTEETLSLAQWSGDALILPRGYLETLLHGIEAAGLECHADDRRLRLPEIGLSFRGELRDYQIRALGNMAPHDCGVLVAPCGSGKTALGMALIARHKQPSLVIVHTLDLLKQTQEAARRWLGVEAGAIGGGKCDVKPVTVATVQTLQKRPELAEGLSRRFGLVMLDECFPSGTIIDGTSIENIKKGQLVMSFNHSKQIVEKASVTHVFKRPLGELVKLVFEGGKELICTKNHPVYILEEGNYIAAGKIQPGEHAFQLPLVREADCKSQQKPAGLFSINGASLLLKRLWEEGTCRNRIKNNDRDKSEIRFGENESTQPYEKPGNEGESKKRASRDRASSEGARRERARTSHSSSCLNGCAPQIFAESGISDSDKNETSVRISPMLQSGYRDTLCEPCDRGGRQQPLRDRATEAGSKERCAFEFIRVDRVESLESSSNGESFGDGCVYNLEVEGNNNYFANGILVHNCHHCPAATFMDAMQRFPATCRYGLTATPNRADGLGRFMEATIGPIRHEIANDELRAANVLVVPQIEFVRTDFHYGYCDDFTGMITALVRDPDRNRLIYSTIARLLGEGRRVIALTQRVEHAELFYRAFEKHRPGAAVLAVGARKKERDEAIRRITEGGARVLFATQLADEGLDAPALDALVLMTPQRAEGKTIQRVGRILRSVDGKRQPVVIDLVDASVPMLRNQAHSRFFGAYRQLSPGCRLPDWLEYRRRRAA